MRNGDDRRDRDLLVEIHTVVTKLEEGFAKHLEQDRDDFATVHRRINKLNWLVGMGAGGLMVAEFILNFFNR